MLIHMCIRHTYVFLDLCSVTFRVVHVLTTIISPEVLNAVMQHAAGSSKLAMSRAAAPARKRFSTHEGLVDTCRGRVASAAGGRDVPTDFVPSVSFGALQELTGHACLAKLDIESTEFKVSFSSAHLH